MIRNHLGQCSPPRKAFSNVNRLQHQQVFPNLSQIHQDAASFTTTPKGIQDGFYPRFGMQADLNLFRGQGFASVLESITTELKATPEKEEQILVKFIQDMKANPQVPSVIRDALVVALPVHKGQTRNNPWGWPYNAHILGTAALVSRHTNNPEYIAAALLHDIVEDHGGKLMMLLIQMLFDRYNPQIARIVSGCSDNLVEIPSFPPPPENEDETHRKARLTREFYLKRLPVLESFTHLSMADPVGQGILLIKAADKLDNLSWFKQELRYAVSVKQMDQAAYLDTFFSQFSRGKVGYFWNFVRPLEMMFQAQDVRLDDEGKVSTPDAQKILHPLFLQLLKSCKTSLKALGLSWKDVRDWNPPDPNANS